MFATKDLDFDELIFSERPLSCHLRLEPNEYMCMKRLGLPVLKDSLEQLVHTEMGEREQTAYLSLSDCHSAGPKTPLGIWNTNAFSTQNPDQGVFVRLTLPHKTNKSTDTPGEQLDEEAMVVLAEMSRINHRFVVFVMSVFSE